MAKHALAREISTALIIKLAALMIIYVAFFGASHKPIMGPAVVSQALFGSSSANPH